MGRIVSRIFHLIQIIYLSSINKLKSMYMINETKVKMITVVSVYKSKEKRTMKFVQLTSEQFGNYFPKDSVCEFSHIYTLPSEKKIKIGIISVSKMTIGLTEKIVVELTPCSFTKRFSKGPFNVFTKCGVRFPKPIEDDVTETELPTEKVVELPSLNVPETSPQSETTDTTNETNNDLPTETVTTPLYITGPSPIRSLRKNYSPIFRSNNYSMWYQLNKIA